MKNYVDKLVQAGVLVERADDVWQDGNTLYYITAGYDLTTFHAGERHIDEFEYDGTDIIVRITDNDYESLELDNITPADITIIKKTVVTLTELLGE
jgi:hypothetical protein